MFDVTRDGILEGANGPFTIEVVGEGQIAAAPDQATIQLGAVTEGLELKMVQEENAKAIEAIIEALLAAGIPEQSVQTVEFHLDPQYDFPDGQQVFRNYRLTHMLQITTNRIDELGRIIDAAVASGANQVNSIQFSFSDPDAYYNQALASALVSAQAKAETMAASLKVQLSAVPRKVQELRANSASPVRFGIMPKLAADTMLMPGEQTVKAEVRVWYWYQ